MKKFRLQKLTFFDHWFKKISSPFVFWELMVGLFFGGLALVVISHIFIFYWFESQAKNEIGSKVEKSLFDREKLSEVYNQLQLKQENFDRYFNEKPSLEDPS